MRQKKLLGSAWQSSLGTGGYFEIAEVVFNMFRRNILFGHGLSAGKTWGQTCLQEESGA
jgi:hypothetical protein